MTVITADRSCLEKPVFSANDVTSAVAVVSNKRKERSSEEKEFDKIVRSCVRKRSHKQDLYPNKNRTRRKAKRLYSVTTLSASSRFGGRRTVAIYDNFDMAVESVEKNYGDIYEYSYSLCVIEAVFCNYLYGCSEECYWYKWYGSPERKGSGYKPIHTPKAYESICGFGIG